jgi:hypothetical protein
VVVERFDVFDVALGDRDVLIERAHAVVACLRLVDYLPIERVSIVLEVLWFPGSFGVGAVEDEFDVVARLRALLGGLGCVHCTAEIGVRVGYCK